MSMLDHHPDWEMGSDGLPVHKRRDPKCKACNGHGIVDDGNNFGCCLVDCVCTKTKNMDAKI